MRRIFCVMRRRPESCFVWVAKTHVSNRSEVGKTSVLLESYNMTRSLCAAVATVAFLVLAQAEPARAGAILFTDRADFNAAVGGTTLLISRNRTRVSRARTTPAPAWRPMVA